MVSTPLYDLRYLAGVVLFNRRDYFAAHEVWEDLWHDCPSADRRFYQSLIQAAVALYHWARGNETGARRLFDSGRRYMTPFGPRHLGLDVSAFWAAVGRAVAGPRDGYRPPEIALAPAPAAWPGDAAISRLLDSPGDGP
jgi:predicted metal-dependent hydrolase